MIPTLSTRLVWGLVAFATGLVVIGVAALLLLLRAGRRQPDEDVARRLLRNSALPLLIQFLVRGIDLAFAYVLYRFVTQAAMGEYDLAALLVSLYLATISEWGLGTLLTREVARDPPAIRHTFGTALLLRLGLSVAALPIALLVIGGYQGLHNTGVIPYAISTRGAVLIGILALTLVPGAVGAAVTSVFLAMERPVVPALANLLNNVVSTALRLLALLLGFGVVGVAWAALAATVLNGVVFTWLLRRHFGWPGWEWDGSLARYMLQAAFPLMLNSLLVVVFFRFDAFIVEGAHGPQAVANYGAAYRVAQLALIVPPIVVNALFPRFARQARDDRQGLLRGYELTVRVLLLGALPLAAVVSVSAPRLVAIFAGEEYSAAGGAALALLIWFVPLSYVNGIAQYVLIALDRQGAITRAFAATAAFNLAANLLLVPQWGIRAAAITTVISELVLYLPFRRVLHAELGAAPLWPVLWRPALATLFMAAVMVPLREQPALAASMGLGLYGVSLWALGTFSADDRLLMRRLLGRGSR
ncbi:MAG: flippase [Chloroflexota bacterium]|nr:flippase [Chloroflexota bacterium]